MKEKLEQIRANALEKLSEIQNVKSLEEARVALLGKKSELTQVLRGMGSLSAEERPVIGSLANSVRQEIEAKLAEIKEKISTAEMQKKLASETLDVTIPGKKPKMGKLHPLTQTLMEIQDIFLGMGFDVVDGPEVELDHYCFEALNIPKWHPARDTQDTFYIDENVVLRTHTSPVQIRVMENKKPPVRIIVPGRVYRSDELDASHSPVFNQVEGLAVDENITMSDLRGVLAEFATKMFGSSTKTRFRPHHFPFTEPSAEVDVSCTVCGGKGCRMCKGTGWLEILGSGMVHPKVLINCGIDPEKYQGFAFGMGLDRITNLKYRIDDIRYLYENDVNFLEQF